MENHLFSKNSINQYKAVDNLSAGLYYSGSCKNITIISFVLLRSNFPKISLDKNEKPVAFNSNGIRSFNLLALKVRTYQIIPFV
jgi:hypothetical protein